MVMIKNFGLSFRECSELMESLQMSVLDLKDSLRPDGIRNQSVREILFESAVDKKTLLLRLRSFLYSY